MKGRTYMQRLTNKKLSALFICICLNLAVLTGCDTDKPVIDLSDQYKDYEDKDYVPPVKKLNDKERPIIDLSDQYKDYIDKEALDAYVPPPKKLDDKGRPITDLSDQYKDYM